MRFGLFHKELSAIAISKLFLVFYKITHKEESVLNCFKVGKDALFFNYNW